MKLTGTDQTQELQGEMVQSEFGIGNPWLLLEYMTKTIYSNIPRVVIQEIASNARDAHREIGQKRPIRIKLPNRLDHSLQIRDFGPGITPVRMHDIFKQYGNSTKRGDNKQTGGFGIGSKVPFGYTDTFTIRTITNENNNLVLREYSAVKGLDRKLELFELGKPVIINPNDVNTPADDKHTGTTIIVDIKYDDFHEFKKWAISITEWWGEERPEITGVTPIPDYQNHQVAYEQPGWKLLLHNNIRPIICVDGIPYPIEWPSLNIPYGDDIYRLENTPLVLYFGVGELSLALSREAIQYDNPTRKKITDRFQEVHNWMKVKLEQELSACLTYREAIYKYQELTSKYEQQGFRLNPLWQGKKVSQFHFYIPGICWSRQYSMKDDRIVGKKLGYLNISKDEMFVFCDEKEISVLKIYSLFQANPHIKFIDVFGIHDDKDPLTILKRQAEYDDFAIKTHMAELEVINLSTIEKMKRAKIPKNITNVVHAYQYNGRNDTNHLSNWNATKCDLENDAGVYLTICRGDIVDYPNLGYQTLKNLRIHLGSNMFPLFGIPQRFQHKMGPNWIKLSTKIDEVLDALETKIDLKAVAEKESLAHSIFRDYERGYNTLKDHNFFDIIDEKDNALQRWIDLSKETEKLNDIKYTEYESSKYIRSLLGKPLLELPQIVMPVETARIECLKQYPLLFTIMKKDDTPLLVESLEELGFYINAKNKLNQPAIAV
jgi:hypothetical protein